VALVSARRRVRVPVQRHQHPPDRPAPRPVLAPVPEAHPARTRRSQRAQRRAGQAQTARIGPPEGGHYGLFCIL